MTWLRVDDRILRHPKFVRAERLGGSAAIHLWLAMATWCSENLTDGEIPPDLLHAVGGPRGAKVRAKAQRALAEASLMARRSDGGVTLVDYLQYNPSAADVRRDRGRRAQNQQSYRHRRNVTDNAPDGVIDNEPVSNHVPSRPVPSPSHSKKSESSAPEPDTFAPPKHPGPLKQSTRELGAFGAPALKHEWDPDWLPTREHQARGFELGLTDDDIGNRLFDCQHKPFPNGFKTEDHQFMRELAWEARDKKIRIAKEARSGANWEKPGAHRQRSSA